MTRLSNNVVGLEIGEEIVMKRLTNAARMSASSIDLVESMSPHAVTKQEVPLAYILA